MKKVIIPVIFSLLLIQPVWAQTSTLERLQNRWQEMKIIKEQRQNEFRNKVETLRTELKERIQTKKEELKQQLQKIKDENKKKIVERIDKNIDALNEKILNHFSNVLEHLENVLDKISSRADKAEANGQNVVAVRTAIIAVNEAISVSRSAIAIQAKKTYTIVINNEETLRIDVGKARQALHADLVKVRETVFAAREAVKKAAAELHKIQGIDELEI